MSMSAAVLIFLAPQAQEAAALSVAACVTQAVLACAGDAERRECLSEWAGMCESIREEQEQSK